LFSITIKYNSNYVKVSLCLKKIYTKYKQDPHFKIFLIVIGKTGNEELTMVEKHKIMKKFSKEYNKSGKKGKGVIGEEI